MRTRRSARNQELLWKYLRAPEEKKPDFVQEKPWLQMSDVEIDKRYFHYGKADRTRMKREALKFRLREKARKALEEENE